MTSEDEGGGGTVREASVSFVCLRAVCFRVWFSVYLTQFLHSFIERICMARTWKIGPSGESWVQIARTVCIFAFWRTFIKDLAFTYSGIVFCKGCEPAPETGAQCTAEGGGSRLL
jgi:hypothetical protein